jgi:hypothetical protein
MTFLFKVGMTDVAFCHIVTEELPAGDHNVLRA